RFVEILDDKFSKALKKSSQVVGPARTLVLSWSRSAFFWGAGAGLMALYFVDWRVLFSRIPGYRRKFKVDDINTN
ncbi:uncharacterized protein DEA37_0015139, partial [Paragonimus westermani]